MEIAIGFVLFVMAVSGVIGALLGSSVNKGFEGFFLGFFLPTIGWIIVLLLPRETSNSPQTPTQAPKERPSPQAKAAKERPPRDLTSDEYKVFLGKKYEITRNELFDKFESDGKLFESLDAALKYADELEAEAEAEIQAEIEAEKDVSEMTFADIQEKLGKKRIWATMPIWKGGYNIEEPEGKEQHFETLSDLQEYYKKVMNK